MSNFITYDYERLSEVLYPKNLFNRVTYTYGKPGEKYNRAGRLVLVEDASGGEAYYYGNQGEVVKTVRSVMVSTADVRTYVYGATYDSWNRVRTMTYPDGEVVTYHYNAAGQIVSLSGNKQGRESVIVDRIGYDKDGHTVYTKLGNGTETTYTYDKQRERLQAMNLTADGRAVMENKYQYDAVDNILGIVNAVDPTQANSNNNNSNNSKAKLGGAFNHTYAYDDLNRLIKANGMAKGAKYEMTMTFGRMSEPLTKVQKVDSTKTAQSYDFTYQYEDSNHPTAPTQIGHEHYTYDANGNPTLVENDSLNTERRMYWDEDNRLMVLSDNGKTSRYTYNAAGERIVKSHGDLEGVYVNGAPQGLTFHETEDYTIYPAPIITVTKNRFTKHYFIGDKRIASKLGTGKFSNVYGISSNNVTAGQKDYAARMLQIEKQREDYYRKLGTPPGVPTMKGATADPDNTGYGYNTIIGDLGDHSVPEGWVQRPKFNEKGDVPGPPIQWQKPEDPDNAQPGYGYVPTDTTNTEDIFFYHSDHLGSTSYITDAKANITQFDAYLPYGELLVDEHSSSEEMPYKFNGKEFDQETGLYYYGARYMDPMASIWYGVDKLTEKYVSVSSYTYCNGNPIANIDVMGMFPKGIVVKHVETVVQYQAVGSANTLMGIPHEVTYYTFTESAAHLLSLVANVPITYVKNARLEEFILQPEGNCITIGGSPDNARILVSPYYLDNSKGGQDYDLWFREFSHEVGHIKQIARDKSLTKYLLKTIAGYIKAGNHDDASREIEAEQGSDTFNTFRRFVKTHFKASVENLFKNDKLDEKDKIEQINKWWNEFKKETNNKK